MELLCNSIQTTNNTIVITAEQASSLQKRNSAINGQLAEIEKTYSAKQKQLNGSDGGLVREVEAEVSSLVPGPRSLPEGQPSTSWWRSLSSGSGDRLVSVEAAKFVLVEIAGPGAKFDFGDADPTLGELWAEINANVGAGGWEALVRRGSPQDGPAGFARRGRRGQGVREG